ncbi:MAG: hypothetical protein JWM27_397 [Gemmatimonadetes bacterium]|nr:hypothetical protein [Gemmatimonadota bacterium]
MSLLEFQRALADLAASPQLCRELRAEAGPVLDRWRLDPRERTRVEAAVRHPGWVVNCTLWRANRLGPIYTLLSRSCYLLGDRFRDEVERFWTLHPRPDFMTRREVPRFGAFLHERLRSGGLRDPYLDEVLTFELAFFELGLLPRRQIAAETEEAMEAFPGTPLRLHPLVRVIRFSHDPAPLLDVLRRFQPVPADLAAGEFYLVVDGRQAEERQMGTLPPPLGRRLHDIAAGGSVADGSDEEARLVRPGLAVPDLAPISTEAIAV